MFVRILEEQDILPALHLTWEVFAADVAPTYPPEGVAEFQKFIKYENILPLVRNGEMVFFGAWEGQELCGISALHVTKGGHISLLFVKKSWQLRGVGRMLYQEMCRFCIQRLRVSRVTVNAAPGAVESYRHYGMYATSPEQTVNGIRFVPMEANLYGNISQKKENKTKKAPLIIGIVAGVILMVALLGWIVSTIVEDVVSDGGFRGDVYEIPFDDEEDEYEEVIPGIQDNEGEESELSGLDAIEEYREDGVTYEITDGVYTEEGKDTKTTVINFEVHFPQITGLDSSVQDDINAKLKEYAMETAEKIYLNPDMDMKEKVLKVEYPVLASYVEYKVTYLSSDFMCVVYQDYCYEGSEQDSKVKLRTLNINLKDGTVYNVKDIVELSDDFIDTWLEEMRDEADTDELLSELNSDEMKKYLSGEDEMGIYSDNFFVDADGIEIGFGFDYPADDENNKGFAWVTAPFDMDEIMEYRTDSEFWNLVSGK